MSSKKNGHKARIAFKGTQVVSIGIWDKLPGTSKNFWVTASTEQKVIFPECPEFEGKSCSIFVAEKSFGLCSDRGILQKLECIDKTWTRKSNLGKYSYKSEDIEDWESQR